MKFSVLIKDRVNELTLKECLYFDSYLVALSLQQEQQVEQPPVANNGQSWQPPPDGALEPTFSE